MQVQTGKKVSDIATVLLDEAFALLVLKNIWEDMIEIDINEYYEPKKNAMTTKTKMATVEKIQIPLLLMLQKTMVMARLWLLDIGQVLGVDHMDMVDGVLMD